MKHSPGFDRMFWFFVASYRTGILSFCGERLDIRLDRNANSAKECFKHFENGKYKMSPFIATKHPNLLRAAITGKKGWGLWVDQWTDGIAEGSFTWQEILGEFTLGNIEIPESLDTEFHNRLHKKRIKRHERYKQAMNPSTH